jgi:hypothetical protein
MRADWIVNADSIDPCLLLSSIALVVAVVAVIVVVTAGSPGLPHC